MSTSQLGGRRNRRAEHELARKKEAGESEMTLFKNPTNEGIKENLRVRFNAGVIYTNIGPVLISVNPFRDLGLYTPEVLQRYIGKGLKRADPHVYAIAGRAFHDMKVHRKNQCIIISGESGAGKTEAAKRLMEYIASVSGGRDKSIQAIKDMVLATNPLLESFGNAKTLRNNNSSRFGKYLQIHFNAQGEPVGAVINNYLLEKTRVVGQIQDERNFHIFYQFAKAASKNYQEAYGIKGPEAFKYINSSNCLGVPGIDDVAEFSETLNAMNVIGMTQPQQDNLFRLLAAILWIGNLKFLLAENSDNAYLSKDEDPTIDFIAYLLQVDSALLRKTLTVRVVETIRGSRRGSVYESPYNIVQAISARDALSKAIYFNMFDWIVARINLSLKSQAATSQSIGILDIYGFEIFPKNSFEQLCINYVNEKLQQIFIQLTLKSEQDDYKRENIHWKPIEYFNNDVVCDLIESKRPPGILAALNDACATAHADSSAADQTFSSRLNTLANNKHFEALQGQFVIKHYAGDVSYAVEGMTDKNKDQLLKDLLNLIHSSQNPFLRELFPDEVNQDDKRRPPTAGDKIKTSASELFDTLLLAEPSYIRTIKPNEHKSAKEFHNDNVLHQVKYLGLEENVRIRKAGFAKRTEFEDFVDDYYILSPEIRAVAVSDWRNNLPYAVKKILQDLNIPPAEYEMGVTKIFIRTPETHHKLEDAAERMRDKMARRIQEAWRNYCGVKPERDTHTDKFWGNINGSLDLEQFKDVGHRILAQKKQRRRVSLLGYRTFLGDYLGIDVEDDDGDDVENAPNKKEGISLRYIRSVVGIPSTENVIFSIRKAQILESHFFKSSKVKDRALVLTEKFLYILSEDELTERIVGIPDLKIPVNTIRHVACTNLQDDWFSIGLESSSQADPLLNCSFKTELFTWLYQLSKQQIQIKVGPTLSYNRKPGKATVVKANEDPSCPRFSVYKSKTISIGRGESPSSVSKPIPQRKQKAHSSSARRPNLPSLPIGGGATTAVPLPSRPMNNVSAYTSTPSVATPTSNASTVSPTLSAPSTTNGYARRPRPAPPPQPSAPPQNPLCKTICDFVGSETGLLSIKTNDILVIKEKADNGWWLVHPQGSSRIGWVPASYVKEIKVVPEQPPQALQPPPPPPRPFQTSSGWQSALATPAWPIGRRTVAAPSLQESESGSGSGPGAAGATMAGGLAEALRARQQAMQRSSNGSS